LEISVEIISVFERGSLIGRRLIVSEIFWMLKELYVIGEFFWVLLSMLPREYNLILLEADPLPELRDETFIASKQATKLHSLIHGSVTWNAC
jgi:hypothetical protein